MSPQTVVNKSKRCVDCGWRTFVEAQSCPMCGGGLVDTFGTESDIQELSPRSFSLATLLMGITAICVGLGVLRQFPYIGIAYLIAILPAIGQTIARNRRSTALGNAVNAGTTIRNFIYSFVASVVAVVLSIAAACVAFFASCFGVLAVSHHSGVRNSGPGFNPPAGLGFALLFALLMALVAAIVVAVVVIKATWPRMKR